MFKRHVKRRHSNHPGVSIQVTDEINDTKVKLSVANLGEQPNKEDEEPLQGDFTHYKKKLRHIRLDELREKPEPFFHVDVGAHFDSYFRGQRVRFKEKKAENYASVVDLDAYEYHKVVFHTFLNEILQSFYFRTMILVLVMLNAIMIGLQTFPFVTNTPMVVIIFAIIDQIILSIFIFEILLKWLYDFRLFWKVSWNILDIIIISFVVISAVLPRSAGTGSSALVTIRVIRAFRSLRSVSSMASLSIVAQTVKKSGRDMLNIIMVLIIFMLVMSVMGVILFDTEDIGEVDDFVNGLDAWYCVFVCVTQDGVADLIEEYLRVGENEEDNNYDKLLIIYLIIGISAGGFVFANLIVAVIVTNLEKAVEEFRDEKAMTENPLDFESDQLSSEVDILPVHDLLAQNNTALIAQRPFKIPSLKNISLRRLQAYIALIVALEHNMLEAEIIQLDLEKVMAILASTMAQLNVYKSKRQMQRERDEVLQEINLYSAAATMIPTEKITQIDTLEKLIKMKHARASFGEGPKESF